MAAITAAAIGAGAGILGDIFSSSSQQQTNEQNAAIAAQNNATQIQLAQNAMSYRFADYKRAGVNPMLVTGAPGMQVPSLQQPNLQNPGAAFSNLGSQVTSAIQLAQQNAQIDALKAKAASDSANARNTDAQTDQVIPAQVSKIQAETGLSQQQAQQVHANVTLLNYGLSSGLSQIGMQESTAQSVIRTHLMQMDQQERSDTLLTLIKARNDAQFAASIGAQNIAHACEGEWGKFMALFAVPGLSSGLGVLSSGAKAAASLMP